MANTETKRIDILLIDDHAGYRKGLIHYLSPFTQIRKLGEAANGIEAIEIMGKEHFDIVYLDIQMPRMGGIETARIIKRRYPDTKIIVITMVDHKMDIIEMLEIGVDSYILKDGEEIIKAFEEVAAGNNYLSPHVHKIWAEHLIERERSKKNAKEPILSKREEGILMLYINEKSTKQIAEELFISPFTVKNHLANIRKTLKVKTKFGAFREALKRGLLSKIIGKSK
jgi:DNA-binding NarL/FixJ family response regulator